MTTDMPLDTRVVRPDKFGRESLRGAQMYMGEPDGPKAFIKSLGMEVPTYIAPREDLRVMKKGSASHKHVNYHVPPSMRAKYKPIQLADYDPEVEYSLTPDGWARCTALNNYGKVCQRTAWNRTPFCSNHGGGLHPADKVFITERGVMPSTPEKLTRMQKVEMGIIKVSELSNEEISRGGVRNDDGTWSPNSVLVSAKISVQMRSEFFKRAEDLVKESTIDLLQEMRKIALSPVSEDKDKIQAITWLTERVLGKTPDVLITNKTDSPFDQMMGEIISGSRQEYRENTQALPGGMIEGEFDSKVVIDEEDEELDNEVELAESGREQDSEPQIHSAGSDLSDIEIISESGEPLALRQGVGLANYGDAELPDETPIVGAEDLGKEDSEILGDDGGSSADDIGPGIGDQRGRDVEDVIDAAKIARARREHKERIRKARNKRYAARALGVDSLDNLPYHVVFRESTLRDGSTRIRMKLIAPEDQKSPPMR